MLYLDDLPVDLGRSCALLVGVLVGSHLEEAHAEGVDVDALVVLLVVHLRRHELGRPDHRLGVGLVLERRQPEVADLDTRRRTRDENVVALKVPKIWKAEKLQSETDYHFSLVSNSDRSLRKTCQTASHKKHLSVFTKKNLSNRINIGKLYKTVSKLLL